MFAPGSPKLPAHDACLDQHVLRGMLAALTGAG
jgi:hypothetical protein